MVSRQPGGGVLVYLYGPPAVGKLTVASELQRRTGLRLFHNHLTVDALTSVFDFGTEAFTEVLHRVRLDVLETAARNGIDLIFTNNSAWAVENGRDRFAAFASQVRNRIEAAGGRVLFVQLAAPLSVLAARVSDNGRRAHGKLLDPLRLRTIVQDHDLTPLAPDHLILDTSVLSPPRGSHTNRTRAHHGPVIDETGLKLCHDGACERTLGGGGSDRAA